MSSRSDLNITITKKRNWALIESFHEYLLSLQNCSHFCIIFFLQILVTINPPLTQVSYVLHEMLDTEPFL